MRDPGGRVVRRVEPPDLTGPFLLGGPPDRDAAAFPGVLRPLPVRDGVHAGPSPEGRNAPARRGPARLRIALLLDNLNGGGVQRTTLAVAREYVGRGHEVDLLTLSDAGDLRGAVPAGARLEKLPPGPLALGRLAALAADPGGAAALALPVLLARKPDRTLAHLRGLAAYLRQTRPDALLTGTRRLNLLAAWARRLAGAPTRVLVSERTAPSPDIASGHGWRKRFLPPLMRRAYAQADAIVAVSDGVADDLAALTCLPREGIRTIHNPVIGSGLDELATGPVDHPWYNDGGPPVVLTAGRYTEQKDYPTLVRAFALLRAERPARLVILGGASKPERAAARAAELRGLAAGLGVGAAVDLPGFVANPYAWMARSAVFVLSSAWEGFGNVLVEAMACGCPVVSTDCPSGPSEILAGGRYGPLVPVGDAGTFARAMARVLDAPPDPALLRRRAGEFTVGRAADAYLEALFGRA